MRKVTIKTSLQIKTVKFNKPLISKWKSALNLIDDGT